MGLFDLFGSKKSLPERKASTPSTIKRSDKAIRASDKASEDMQKADADYENDGDLNKKISVYEKYLLKKPNWNSFNFSLALANMYVKAGRNDAAWGYLNQLYLWAIDPSAIGGDVSKIRYEQFRILKAEKKYKDAMVMLVTSYVLNAYAIRDTYFNKNKFKKDAKTTAKEVGITGTDLDAFADMLERDIKAKRIKEAALQKYLEGCYKKLGV
ncbi:MAG: hypothetical protein IJT00_10535 [Lachnospiraceae bacterium]|nr:hypothetical protein [Lachnospiraceae bacterium]